MLRIELPTAAASLTPQTTEPIPPKPISPSGISPVPAPAPSMPQTSTASWPKTLVLASAVVVIGAFVWYLAARFIGSQLWVVKFSIVAILIGVAAGAVVAGGMHRRTEGVKVGSVVAAMIAIMLGKILVVLLLESATNVTPHDAQQWAGLLIRKGFTPVDPLFFAMAVLGSGLRFILWR